MGWGRGGEGGGEGESGSYIAFATYTGKGVPIYSINQWTRITYMMLS